MKKIPISFSDDYQEKIRKLGIKLGIDIDKTYGAIPQIVRISINLADKAIDNIGRSIPDLNDKDLDILLSSIKNHKLLEYARQKKENKEKLHKKV